MEALPIGGAFVFYGKGRPLPKEVRLRISDRLFLSPPEFSATTTFLWED